MHFIFLQKIAFATLITRHLKRGVGVREEWEMGGRGGGEIGESLFH